MAKHPIDRALERLRAHDREGALSLLAEVADGGADPSRRREALAHRAWELRSRGRFAEALADYERCAAIDAETGTTDTGLLFAAAEAIALSGDHERAAREAARVLSIDPLHAGAGRLLARCHVALGLAPTNAPAPSEILRREAASPEPARRVFFNPVVERLNQEAAGFPTSIFPDVGRFLYALVRATRPSMALETGSFIGYSALCIAQALEDNGAGHLHCFDLFGAPPFEYASPVVGKLPTLLETASAHLCAADLSHRTTLHSGDSSAMIEKAFPKAEPVLDFAFIDGDHTAAGCLKDWRAVDARLKEGGVVVLHDTNARGSGWCGPEHLLEQLDKRERENYRWVEVPTLDNLGLGLIRKIKPGTARPWRPGVVELVAERLFMRKAWGKKG